MGRFSRSRGKGQTLPIFRHVHHIDVSLGWDGQAEGGADMSGDDYVAYRGVDGKCERGKTFLYYLPVKSPEERMYISLFLFNCLSCSSLTVR